jgi:uncharacterized protein
MENNAIIIFLKYPESGKVKTRLAKTIGNQHAANLYKNFIIDTLKSVSQLSLAKKVIFAYPKEKIGLVKTITETTDPIYEQEGNDLGQKMYNAFLETHQMGFSKTIIIGTDSPNLPLSHITQAFDNLTQKDVVIGPTSDGGYYLIGCKHNTLSANWFNNVKWSTNTVFQKTIDNIKKEKNSYHILEKWYDIDTYEDLKKLKHYIL